MKALNQDERHTFGTIERVLLAAPELVARDLFLEKSRGSNPSSSSCCGDLFDGGVWNSLLERLPTTSFYVSQQIHYISNKQNNVNVVIVYITSILPYYLTLFYSYFQHP